MNPETDNFDWEIYRALNPDVRLSNMQQYEQHFIMKGDGRPWRVKDKYPDFDPVQYRANYAELANQSDAAVERHWALNGCKSGLSYYVREHYDYIDGIDRVYWINLDRSKERALSMQKILANISGVNIERIEAFDGHNVIKDILERFCFLNKTNYKMTPGAYGCLLSHLETIRKFYESGAEKALILEDDINVNAMPYWDKPLSKIIAEAPPDWQIISLKWGHPLAEPSMPYTSWSEMCYFTAAYIINRAGAENIVKTCWKPYVQQQQYRIAVVKGRRVRVPVPVPVKEESEPQFRWHVMGKRHDADYIVYVNCKTYVYAYSYFLSDETSSTVDIGHLRMHAAIQQKSMQRWRDYHFKKYQLNDAHRALGCS
jgi:hypothetical protein